MKSMRIEVAEARQRLRASVTAGDAIWISELGADDGIRHVEGRLAGVPFGIKDNLFTRDGTTTAGTPALRDFRPGVDAGCVARLRGAGAIPVGKTNLHELAFGVTSENAAFGTVFNPAASGRVAGGSSGGSAAAVAAGHVPFALATDTGGSARLPAAFCGVVGWRPSHGRWPVDGTVPVSPSRDTPGVIATDVDWILRVDAVVAGDATEGPDVADLARIRLGVPRAFYREPLDPCVAADFESGLAHLIAAGLTLVDVDVPNIAILDERIGFPLALGEAARALPAFCCAHGLDFSELVASVAGSDVRMLIAQVAAGIVTDAALRDAITLRPRLLAALASTFARHRLDAIVVPTCPVLPPPVPAQETVDLGGRAMPLFPTVSRNTSPASLVGAPSITLPLPVAPGGMPIGLMLDGLPGTDRKLLALAAMVERVLRRDG